MISQQQPHAPSSGVVLSLEWRSSYPAPRVHALFSSLRLINGLSGAATKVPLFMSTSGIGRHHCMCLDQGLNCSALRQLYQCMIWLNHTHIRNGIYISSYSKQLRINGGKVHGGGLSCQCSQLQWVLEFLDCVNMLPSLLTILFCIQV